MSKIKGPYAWPEGVSITPDPSWDGRTMRFHPDIPTGDCFEAAFKFIASDDGQNDKLRLVHGHLPHLPLLEGYSFNHAWIEDEASVYEVANGQDKRWKRTNYCGMFNVQAVREYTYWEALALGAETTGPWE